MTGGLSRYRSGSVPCRPSCRPSHHLLRLGHPVTPADITRARGEAGTRECWRRVSVFTDTQRQSLRLLQVKHEHVPLLVAPGLFVLAVPAPLSAPPGVGVCAPLRVVEDVPAGVDGVLLLSEIDLQRSLHQLKGDAPLWREVTRRVHSSTSEMFTGPMWEGCKVFITLLLKND